MADLGSLGRLLILSGLALAGVGLLLVLVARIPFLGHLPGDVLIQRGNVTIYFPLITCILISVLLTVVLNLLARR